MTWLVLFFLIAILFSFLCSMWEAVLLSVTPIYAQSQIEQGSSTGRQLKRFKDNIDRPLAAILTLNTLAHTAGAIGVGAQASRIWAQSHPLVTALLVPLVMTLAILILSEIVPKTIGANQWQRLAPFTVRSLQLLIRVLAPLVWLSQLITRQLKAESGASVLRRADFLAMAKLGEEHGVIAQEESTIIASLLRFRSVRVADVMTPRTVMVTVPAETTIDYFSANQPPGNFSRIPLYENDDRDSISQFVLKTDLLSAIVQGRGAQPLRAVARKIPVIPKLAPVPELFRQLLKSRRHIALVVDEFGDISGLVTMEDVIETLLDTEIIDELDQNVDMQQYAKQLWRRRAQRLGFSVDDDPPSSG